MSATSIPDTERESDPQYSLEEERYPPAEEEQPEERGDASDHSPLEYESSEYLPAPEPSTSDTNYSPIEEDQPEEREHTPEHSHLESESLEHLPEAEPPVEDINMSHYENQGHPSGSMEGGEPP